MKKFKDRVGTIWRSIGDNKLSCDPNQDSNTRYCPTREMVEFVYGPLTDVTDTSSPGEPLDAECDDCESKGRNCLTQAERRAAPGE